MDQKELEDGEIASEHEVSPKPDFNNETVIDHIVKKENERKSQSPPKSRTEKRRRSASRSRSRNEKNDKRTESRDVRRHDTKKNTSSWQSSSTSNRYVRAPPLDSIIFPPMSNMPPQVGPPVVLDPAIFRLKSIANQPNIDYKPPGSMPHQPPQPRQNFVFFQPPPMFLPPPPPPAPPVPPPNDCHRDNYEEVGMDLCDERRTPEEPPGSPDQVDAAPPVQIPLQKVPDEEERYDFDEDTLRAQLLSDVGKKRAAQQQQQQQSPEVSEEPAPKRARHEEEEGTSMAKEGNQNRKEKKRELRMKRRENVQTILSSKEEIKKAQEDYNRAVERMKEIHLFMVKKGEEIKQKTSENREIGAQIDEMEAQELDEMCQQSKPVIPMIDLDGVSTPTTSLQLSDISDEEAEPEPASAPVLAPEPEQEPESEVPEVPEPREVVVQSKASLGSLDSELNPTNLDIEMSLREKLLARKSAAQTRKSPEEKEISVDLNSTSSSMSSDRSDAYPHSILTKLCKFELNGACLDGDNCLRIHLHDINNDMAICRELLSKTLGNLLYYKEADIEPAIEEILVHLPRFKTFGALYQCFLSTVMRRDRLSRVRLSEYLANSRYPSQRI